jgi:Type I phosphodiesterase / nucleotide pyrophosphatase
VRFLVQSADASICGGASAWPAPGTTVRVTLQEESTCRPPLQYVHKSAEGDGRRRVFAVLLDSGDWRILRYLQARGEAPVLSLIESRGVRGVIKSDPPGTSAALRKLMFPDRRRRTGVLPFLDDLGTQVTVFAGVAAHPWPALAAFTPQPRSFFDVVGEQSVAVNLLGARGGLSEGHGVVTGPQGARRMLALKPPRVPTDDEAQSFPGLWGEISSLNDAAGEMASLFDALGELARDGTGDVVLARVDATDVAAHVRFHEYSLGTKDDTAYLLAIYRYADRRIGELWSALDQDDVLVVLSDHGTLNELEHDRRALWLAAGGLVRAEPLNQAADLAGVARAIAEQVLAEVPTSWPESVVPLLPQLAVQGDEATNATP